jgi:hypothetical protein
VILTDLGHRLELRAESGIPGLGGRLEGRAWERSREGDWMVLTLRRPAPWSVADKDAARKVLEAYAS